MKLLFSLSELLADEIRRFKFLLGSDKLDEDEMNQYRDLLTIRDEDNTMFGMKLKFSLKRLSELWYKHYAFLWHGFLQEEMQDNCRENRI